MSNPLYEHARKLAVKLAPLIDEAYQRMTMEKAMQCTDCLDTWSCMDPAERVRQDIVNLKTELSEVDGRLQNLTGVVFDMDQRGKQMCTNCVDGGQAEQGDDPDEDYADWSQPAVPWTETQYIEIDPNDPFERVLAEVLDLNRRKRADYTSGDRWSNFKAAARQVNQPAGVGLEVLLATKQDRFRNLLVAGKEPNNEAIRDTVLDRAVYALIGLAMWDDGLYTESS